MKQQFIGTSFIMSVALVASGLSACSISDTEESSDLGEPGELRKAEEFAGHVYAMTNDPQNKAVIHYGRRANGQLVQLGSTPTQGHGSGYLEVPDLSVLTPDPLQSQ